MCFKGTPVLSLCDGCDGVTPLQRPIEQATAEYKKQIVTEARSNAMYRNEVISAAAGHEGKYASEDFNMCMLDVANSFDFQWAGGKPLFIGLPKDFPTVTYGFRRVGPPESIAGEGPNSTD